MTFDKASYRDRRNRGLKGQQPMSPKEVRYEVRQRLKQDMRPTLEKKLKAIKETT